MALAQRERPDLQGYWALQQKSRETRIARQGETITYKFTILNANGAPNLSLISSLSLFPNPNFKNNILVFPSPRLKSGAKVLITDIAQYCIYVEFQCVQFV